MVLLSFFYLHLNTVISGRCGHFSQLPVPLHVTVWLQIIVACVLFIFSFVMFTHTASLSSFRDEETICLSNRETNSELTQIRHIWLASMRWETTFPLRFQMGERLMSPRKSSSLSCLASLFYVCHSF